MEGKTALGASSPAKPALHMPEPLSMTKAATSSSHMLLGCGWTGGAEDGAALHLAVGPPALAQHTADPAHPGQPPPTDPRTSGQNSGSEVYNCFTRICRAHTSGKLSCYNQKDRSARPQVTARAAAGDGAKEARNAACAVFKGGEDRPGVSSASLPDLTLN